MSKAKWWAPRAAVSKEEDDREFLEMFAKHYLYGEEIPTKEELLFAMDVTSSYYCWARNTAQGTVYHFTFTSCFNAENAVSFLSPYIRKDPVQRSAHVRGKCPFVHYKWWSSWR